MKKLLTAFALVVVSSAAHTHPVCDRMGEYAESVMDGRKQGVPKWIQVQLLRQEQMTDLIPLVNIAYKLESTPKGEFGNLIRERCEDERSY